ncbi:MAG: ATP-binding protein, partial [Paludibacter sp.]|nr:ATP-binding protein [Paludibacter sp.]
MFLKNLKISVILALGFSLIFISVLSLGVVSYTQSSKLHENTDILFEHPLKVRLASSKLKIDILEMRLATRDFMLYSDLKNRIRIKNTIESASDDANKQFAILNRQFLGDKILVEDVKNAFTKWKTIRELNFDRIENGEIEVVKNNVLSDGEIGILRDDMLNKIKLIDDFAFNKSKLLGTESERLNNQLNLLLLLWIFAISILIIIIAEIILYNIRKPIKHLSKVANEFQQGNYDTRSTLTNKNEFGILSNSFNSMVESIKLNLDLNEKTTALANSMMIIENSHSFFRNMLPKLAELTNSQMAAVYLLSEDKKEYMHYESIGLTSEANNIHFDATNYEGEFGAVLSSRKIEYHRNIPIDTSFAYQTVSGKFIPREIITIPIMAGNEIIAIISLASVRKYSDEANALLNGSYIVLNSRIEGILNYRKIRRFLKLMETQNTELQEQKSELKAQSIALHEQNRELEIQKVQLNEANKLKTNFLSNMSHELRTPLNSVIALSGVLNRRLKSKIAADEYSYLEVIERNGKHLLSLINDILDISRIEAGKEEVEVTNFSTDSLVDEIVSMIQTQAHQKNIELIKTENKNNITINSDIHKCRHILQNLVANAVKFTEKGKVEISVSEKDDTIQFIVKDTGIGISSEHIKHVFDEFRQADSSTSRRYGGTGLGLSIAKKYANLLGGNVMVNSTLHVGSTFILTLPKQYSEDNRIVETKIYTTETGVAKKQPDARKIISDKSLKTILLVDDSEPAIIQMNDFLSSSGYNVMTAHNGKEALEIISQTIPDTMILDLMMPEIDGFEVLKTIREAEATAHIPVLILTAKQITKEDLSFLTRNNVHQLIQKG